MGSRRVWGESGEGEALLHATWDGGSLRHPRFSNAHREASCPSSRTDDPFATSSAIAGVTRLLVVEDDRGMARLVRLLLLEEGYAVDVAAGGEEALALLRSHTYDGVVLDLGLPDRSGLSVIREARQDAASTPILVLSARTTTADRVNALDTGADDYLTKPFENAELRARVRALVRRGGARRSEQLACGALVLNRLTREALVAGVELDLTAREFAMLEQLALAPRVVVRRTTLLERIWDAQFDPGTNVVDALVSRVRRKLERVNGSPRVVTVRGVGYMLTDSHGLSPRAARYDMPGERAPEASGEHQ